MDHSLSFLPPVLNLANPDSDSLISDLIKGSKGLHKYVIGKNDESRQVIHHFDIDGVIDDDSVLLQSFQGIPVIKSSQISPQSIIINCSSSICPIQVEDNLRSLKLDKIISYGQLRAHSTYLQPQWFVRQQQEDVKKHPAQWETLYQSLDDEESRKTLRDVLCYRLSGNYEYMRDYSVRLEEQYFEAFLKLNQEIFIDAGGFDGDTTRSFCKRDPGYRKIYFFEPSIPNMQRAKERLKRYKNIEYIQKGLSD